MTEINLLPCPFCGSSEIYPEVGLVYCDFCEISLPSSVWNQRSPAPSSVAGKVPEYIEILRRANMPSRTVAVSVYRLLAACEAHYLGDYSETYHQIYMMAHDAAADIYNPFAEWKALATQEAK